MAPGTRQEKLRWGYLVTRKVETDNALAPSGAPLLYDGLLSLEQHILLSDAIARVELVRTTETALSLNECPDVAM